MRGRGGGPQGEQPERRKRASRRGSVVLGTRRSVAAQQGFKRRGFEAVCRQRPGRGLTLGLLGAEPEVAKLIPRQRGAASLQGYLRGYQ